MKFLLVGFGLLAASFASMAGDAKFENFAVKNAHDSGFYGCDEEIKEAFKHANGDDMRINSSVIKGADKDNLRLSASWGSKGFSVYMNSEFRKINNKCITNRVTVLNVEQSCPALAGDDDDFKFVSEVGDHIWYRSKNGGTRILSPIKHGCMVIFTN